MEIQNLNCNPLFVSLNINLNKNLTVLMIPVLISDILLIF